MAGALALIGCDKITGADEKKILDAEAIGYACRVSQKAPENCMKENETQSPTSILKGWKAANNDIEEQVIDPSMGKKPDTSVTNIAAHSAPVATEGEGKPAAEKAVEKASVAKPGKAAADKKAAH